MTRSFGIDRAGLTGFTASPLRFGWIKSCIPTILCYNAESLTLTCGTRATKLRSWCRSSLALSNLSHATVIALFQTLLSAYHETLIGHEPYARHLSHAPHLVGHACRPRHLSLNPTVRLYYPDMAGLALRGDHPVFEEAMQKEIHTCLLILSL